jgi:hypothetical protein
MAARPGIDLPPTACRIVAIDGTPRWTPLRDDVIVVRLVPLPGNRRHLTIPILHSGSH